MPRPQRLSNHRPDWDRHTLSTYLAYPPDIGSGGPLRGVACRLRLHPSEAEARQGYDEIGEQLTRWYAERHPGRRPWSWWLFERGMDRPDSFSEQLAYLEANDLLEPGEAELAREEQAGRRGAWTAKRKFERPHWGRDPSWRPEVDRSRGRRRGRTASG